MYVRIFDPISQETESVPKILIGAMSMRNVFDSIRYLLEITRIPALWSESDHKIRWSFRVIVISLSLLALFSVYGIGQSFMACQVFQEQEKLGLLLGWIREKMCAAQLSSDNVEHVLVFCGSLSNIVAIIGIAGEDGYLPSGQATAEQKTIRRWLTFQMFFLSLAIAWSYHQLSRDMFGPNGTIVIAVVALLTTIFVLFRQTTDYIGIRTTCVTMIALVFFLTALLMTPLIGMFIDPLLGEYLRPRISPYIHLLGIPLLYFVVDARLGNLLRVAKDSFSLDSALLITGIVCCLAGAAVARLPSHDGRSALGSAIFESGSAAVVLLLGNWVWLFAARSDNAKPVSSASAIVTSN